MDKRRFLQSGVAASAAAISAPVLAQASPNVRWRMASSFHRFAEHTYSSFVYNNPPRKAG